MAARRWLGVPAQLTRGLLPAAAAILGAATVLLVPRDELPFTTHAGASSTAAIADAAAGLGLVAAGLVVWLLPPARGSALPLVSLAGVSWLAQDWVGWDGGPAIVRGVAMVIEPLLPAVVLSIVVGFSGAWSRSRLVRWGTVVAYLTILFTSLGTVLVLDPFFDPYCWSNCTENGLLVASRPGLARVLDGLGLGAWLALGLVIAAAAVWPLRSATLTARRRLLPVLGPGFAVGVSTLAYAVALARSRLESTHDPVFSTLFQLRAWSACALAIGVAWVAVRGFGVRAALAQLAADLGDAPAPGSLGHALSRVTGDPTLEVVYPRQAPQEYVDASGRPAGTSTRTDDRTRTLILRDGVEIAAVLHDPAMVDAEQLRTAFGPAARLAIENERLQAEVTAQLLDLRASRGRIVEAGDAERRRLERNLHDGAQQQLLALSYDLRLARAGAASAGVDELAELLSSAAEEALLAVTDLRELAQGIYPAILTEGGIGPALRALSDAAPLPVEVGMTPGERFPEAIERTAFVVVADAIDAAAQCGSDHLSVRVERDGPTLVIEVRGAGGGPLVHVADRVGAIGGHLVIAEEFLRVDLPCG